MTKVKIAEFKSGLSSYLKRVRNGEKIVVTDRETPIAQVLPYTTPTQALKTIPAERSPKILRKLRVPSASGGTDSLKALAEERADDLV